MPHLTLAAVAAGCDALFLEAHPDPMSAKCDAASQMQMDNMEALLKMAISVRKAIGQARWVLPCFSMSKGNIM